MTDLDRLKKKSDRLAEKERRTRKNLHRIRDELDALTDQLDHAAIRSTAPTMLAGPLGLGNLLAFPRHRRYRSKRL
jgi:hypothetical protein